MGATAAREEGIRCRSRCRYTEDDGHFETLNGGSAIAEEDDQRRCGDLEDGRWWF
jgi:hypothetical protein